MAERSPDEFAEASLVFALQEGETLEALAKRATSSLGQEAWGSVTRSKDWGTEIVAFDSEEEAQKRSKGLKSTEDRTQSVELLILDSISIVARYRLAN